MLATSNENELTFIPGMCSNQDPHSDIDKHVLQPFPTTHLLLASSATRLGVFPEIIADYFSQYSLTAPPLIWMEYHHAIVDRALIDLDARALVNGLLNYAGAMLWFKSTEQRLAIAAIPRVKAEDLLDPGSEALLLDYSFSFLTLSLLNGHNIPDIASNLYTIFDEVLPVIPLSLREALNFHKNSPRRNLEEAAFEWCRCLHQSDELFESAQGLSLFLFRGANYLAVSPLRHISGKAMVQIARDGWNEILEHQRFLLSLPNVHEPAIRKALDSDVEPLANIANILLVTESAARLPIAQSGKDFLTSLRDGLQQNKR